MCLFGNIVEQKIQLNDAGKIAAEEWCKTGEMRSNILIDEFIIMPNHLHGIIVIENVLDAESSGIGEFGKPASNAISSIIRGYKSAVTKKIGILNSSSLIASSLVWQRNYYEHVIRHEASYLKIREYIINNPFNWQDDKYFI
jgi:putative transposase